MPIPFIVGGIAVATGALGAKKGYDAVVDTKKAKTVNQNAQGIIDNANNKLDKKRSATNVSLENLGKCKLDILATTMKEFIEEFEKIKNIELSESTGLEELNHLNFDGDVLNDMRNASIEASKIIKGGVTALGSGVLTAYGAYGAVMTLGTASTGTAITTLSGVAATNATLAWLGGGSLAAGGGGMALGSVVLGGLVAGPALAVGGFILSSQAKKKLNDARGNLQSAKKIETEMSLAGTSLNNIRERANYINNILVRTDDYFRQAVNNLKYIVENEGVLWENYKQNSKYSVYATLKIAQVIKSILDTSLIDENGKLTTKSQEIIEEGDLFLYKNNMMNDSEIESKGIKELIKKKELEEPKTILLGEGESIKEEEIPNVDFKEWRLGINGVQKGPYSLKEIEPMLINNEIDMDKCYVWKNGMENWKYMSAVEEFIELKKKVQRDVPPPLPTM